jgi:hypothetical protein
MLKGDLIFADEEGVPRGIPSFDACTSWIFFEMHGHPQA